MGKARGWPGREAEDRRGDRAEVTGCAGVSSGKAGGANSLGRASLNSPGGSGLQGRPLVAWSWALRWPLLRPEVPPTDPVGVSLDQGPIPH